MIALLTLSLLALPGVALADPTVPPAPAPPGGYQVEYAQRVVAYQSSTLPVSSGPILATVVGAEATAFATTAGPITTLRNASGGAADLTKTPAEQADGVKATATGITAAATAAALACWPTPPAGETSTTWAQAHDACDHVLDDVRLMQRAYVRPLPKP